MGPGAAESGVFVAFRLHSEGLDPRESEKQARSFLRAIAAARRGGKRVAFQVDGEVDATIVARVASTSSAIELVRRALSQGETAPDASPSPMPAVAISANPGRFEDGIRVGSRELHSLARALVNCAHPAQVLLSPYAASAVRAVEGYMLHVRPIGEHVVTLDEPPMEVYQFQWDGKLRTFPPIASVYPIRHNLPLRATAFVGRAEEEEELAELLAQRPLVTIIGEPGIGKTGLACSLALRLCYNYPGGVWYTKCYSESTADSLIENLLSEAHTEGSAQLSATDQIRATLGGKPALVVLDGWDMAPAAARHALEMIVSSVDNVRVLATGREPIGDPFEATYGLGPLSMQPNGDVLDAANLYDYDAPQLLLDRLEAQGPHFTLTDEDAAIIGELCNRLNGSPAAIQGIAAEVLARGLAATRDVLVLRDAYRESSGRPRLDAPYAAVAKSYDALPSDAQRLLRRLSVLCADWPAAVACAVAPRAARPKTTRLLSQISSAGLLEAEYSSAGELRFSLRPEVATFLAAQIDEGERLDAQRAHIIYYAEVVERANELLTGPESETGIQRIASEYPNIRLALMRAIAGAVEPQTAFRLLCFMGAYWLIKGPRLEARELARSAVPLVEISPSALAARALNMAGVFGWNSGETEWKKAEALHHRAAELARRHGDRLIEAMARQNQSAALRYLGELPRSMEIMQESLAAFRELGNMPRLATALSAAATLLFDMGYVEEAIRNAEESIAVYHQCGDEASALGRTINLSDMELKRGQPWKAWELLVTTVPLVIDLGYHVNAINGVCSAATVASALGLFEQAATLVGATYVLSEHYLDGASTFEGHLRAALETCAETLSEDRVKQLVERGREFGYGDVIRLMSTVPSRLNHR